METFLCWLLVLLTVYYVAWVIGYPVYCKIRKKKVLGNHTYLFVLWTLTLVMNLCCVVLCKLWG